MEEPEGVTKFRLEVHREPIRTFDLTSLNAWRHVLTQVQMLGQVPERYGGLGFGNLSMRTESGFLITGTQTGSLESLESGHFSEVTDWDTTNNSVIARGEVAPSSESLTHAAVYSLHEDIRFVFHVHDPVLWRNAEVIGLKQTSAGIAYGTPEMAREVDATARDNLHRLPFVFSMGGHEDGVIAFGKDARTVGLLLLESKARAIAIASC